jgi:aryl-alcohol dehydrogenase-like predicted oxidoreductase
MVGEALKPYRDRVVIATKFGIHLEHGSTGAPIPDARPEVIHKSVEGSLKRLGVDCIDLYYQHRIDPEIPAEEVASLMSEFIKEGKIKHWGVSEATEDYIRRAHEICPISAVENRYSMMARHYESLFPVLAELDIGFVAFSPMANGFLTGKYDKNAKFEAGTDYRNAMPQFTAEGIDKNRELLELLHDTARDKNATPAQISMAWMLCKRPWIVPIPGTRKVERLKENAGAATIELTAEEVRALDNALDAVPMSDVFGGTKK